MAEKPLIAGHLMGLFTAISFGSAYPVAKPIVGVVDPFVFSAARYLVAGTILMLGVAIFAGGKFLPPRRDFVRLTIAGFLGFAVFQGLWGVALDLTTASKAAVLVSTTPIFGALIQAAEGQRLPAPAWAGIAVAFAGVFCVINNSFTTLNVAGGSLLGDAMFVGIAGVWALYGALSRPVIARIGAVRTAAWSALLGSLFLLPLAVPGLVRQEWGNVDPSLAVNFAHVALIIGCLGMLTWNGGLKHLGLARMTVWLYLTPVSAMLLANILLGEFPTTPQIAGALLVVLGVFLTQR